MYPWRLSYKRLFQKALKNILRGEKITRKGIEKEEFEKQLLWLYMRRFISHAKAIVVLCKKRQNLEALMLLRPIVELVVNLRWIVEDKSLKNREKFLKYIEYKFDDDIPQMGEFWSDKNLLGRMKDIGFDEHYYKMVVKKLHEELHENPAVVARSYNKELTSMNSEAIFSIASQFAGHLLKVANEFYGQRYFMYHLEIWNKIKFDQKHYQKRKSVSELNN